MAKESRESIYQGLIAIAQSVRKGGSLETAAEDLEDILAGMDELADEEEEAT